MLIAKGDAALAFGRLSRWFARVCIKLLSQERSGFCHTRRMSQATYRMVPLSIIRYAIEVMQPDKAARILLTCPTEDAANAWMDDMKRRSEDRRLHD